MQIFASGFALLLAAMQGEAYVADGATLVIGGTPVQLSGIDVPDVRTEIGAAARAEVQGIVAASVVTCRSEGERSAGRILATCRAGGDDIAATLVRRGLALDCAAMSNGRYRDLEPDGSRARLAPSARCRR